MRRVLTVLVLLAILTAPTIVVYADDGYTISTDKTTIPVPSQSYTISGTQVSIETLTRVSGSEDLPVSIEAPVFNDKYSLILYNKQKQRVWSQTLEGDAAATVPTAQISAGTYVLVINGPDGDLRAVRPVLIAGYSVSVSHSNTGTVDESTSVSVSVSEIGNQQPDISDVQVVFTTSNGVRQVNLSDTGDGEYSGNVVFQEATTVELYGVVRGYEQIQQDGQQEALGASKASSISILEPTPSPTPSPTLQSSATTSTTESREGSGGDTGSGSGADSNDTEQTVTETPTATKVPVTAPSAPTTTTSPTPTPSPTVATETDQPVTQTQSTVTPTVSSTPQTTSTETATDTPTTPQSPATPAETTQPASDVITPNNVTLTTEQPATTTETPLSPVLALTALLVITVFALPYKNNDT